jgi:hypothetical protein
MTQTDILDHSKSAELPSKKQMKATFVHVMGWTQGVYVQIMKG